MRREERRQITEVFTQDPDCQVLVATDAAGEGLNLQRAHLMVNYDLPWNPNRIEQRFGRIHRIGQTEVCHLWNLVADDTREGEVFARLLDKLEEQRKAYGGKVFDVLGEAFEETPLRDLLIEAIRYGDQPEVRARLDAGHRRERRRGLDELIAERASHTDMFAAADLEKRRARMDEARARRLQPHYIEGAFRAAFTRLGGRIREREPGRFEITHVPAQRPRPATPRPRRHALRAGHLRPEHVARRRQAERRPARPRPPAARRGDRPDRSSGTARAQRGHRARLPARSHEPRLLVGGHPGDHRRHDDRRSRRRSATPTSTQHGTVEGAGPAPYLDYVAAPPTDAVIDGARATARGCPGRGAGGELDHRQPAARHASTR